MSGISPFVVAVKAGVRQGCPLSPTLFILVMEPLACALRTNELIKGLTPPGRGGLEIKFSMYMDDITLLLTDNKSIEVSLAVCEAFSAASGMKINKEKSEVIYFKWREIKEKRGLQEKSETLKILGVEIGENMQIKNWNSKLQKIQGKLLNWKDRELSFIGKVLVLKAEVMASIAFLATTLPIPYEILISLRKAMFYFLWGGQHERAKREIMYKPVGKGGRAVPEIESKCNAMFITPIFKACFIIVIVLTPFVFVFPFVGFPIWVLISDVSLFIFYE
uniref:Reverse transcriptase domain-containing protein n=1 Tax=Neolamprologus brichardi TaxID=32507 RepID=A0A3Q4HUH7_NEOBR